MIITRSTCQAFSITIAITSFVTSNPSRAIITIAITSLVMSNLLADYKCMHYEARKCGGCNYERITKLVMSS